MTKKQKASSKPPAKPPLNPQSMEQMMRDLTRLLNDQQFESIEEANRFLQELMAGGQPIPTAEPRSDLDRAQEIIYQASEARSRTQAIKLARRALMISPDCADGYVLLAEVAAETPAEAWAFYEAGVKAGRRALGETFEEDKGHFWGILETRPYMRARLGLANILWEMGRLEEAADHMAEMLVLNPNDNQGVRQLYITLLLELNDTKRLEKLLKQYPDDWSAAWKYGCALYEFRKQGPSGKADALLSDAIAYNPHVPDYLLGKKKLPQTLPAPYYSPGDETEAIDYAQDGIRPWTKTEGALAWLQEVVAKHNR